MSLAAALRSPHLSARERSRRIDSKLIELGLNERRNSVVGSTVKKALSGGERKRLNIGLDMIGLADIYLFDEPTSGLSSKDSEHVVEIIRSMSHNKIVLVTIHQPSSKIFQMFNKVILLDKGGRLVFFGTPTEALQYFAEAENAQGHGVDVQNCVNCGSTRPEFIFDVLETPLRDMSGDIIYEENLRGQLVPARRFSPEYWRDKYESHRLIQDVRSVPLKRETAARTVAPMGPPPRRHWFGMIRWRDEWTQLRTLLRRAFFSKMRNRVNVVTTLVEAPLLSALIAVVLRYNESGTYNFAGSYHIPIYLFLAVTVAMFLGLTNSADDIIRDRVVLQRERNLPHPTTLLHLCQDDHALPVRTRAVRALSAHRRIHSGSARHVLDRPVVHGADGVLRRGAGPLNLLARRRRQDGGEHRAAHPHPADHHGRSAHQVRGHEP